MTFFTYHEINILTNIKFQYHELSTYQKSEGIRTIMYTNNSMFTYHYQIIINTSKLYRTLNILRVYSFADTCPHAWPEGYLNHYDFTASCCIMIHEISLVRSVDK